MAPILNIERDTIAEKYRSLFVQKIATRIMKENKIPQDKIRRSKKSERTLINSIKRELNALWHTLENQKETNLTYPSKDEKNFTKEGNITKMYRHLFITKLTIKKMKKNNVPHEILRRAETSGCIILGAIEKAIDNIHRHIEENHKMEERIYAFTINCGNCLKNYARGSDGNIVNVEDMEGETYDEKFDLFEKLKHCPCKEDKYPKDLCADFEPINPLIDTHYPGFNYNPKNYPFS